VSNNRPASKQPQHRPSSAVFTRDGRSVTYRDDISSDSVCYFVIDFYSTF
jgi:hypothetical protein